MCDAHKQQVVQVWLTLDAADEMVPDTLEAWEPVLQRRQRCHYETLHILFTNVTNFGHKVQDWAWTKADHLLFLQETHMGTKALEATMQYTSAQGDGEPMEWKQRPRATVATQEASSPFMVKGT